MGSTNDIIAKATTGPIIS